MSPTGPCPYCGKEFTFHEDEVEGVADGSVVCLDCGMEVAMNAWITDVIAGEAELPPLDEDEEEEGDIDEVE